MLLCEVSEESWLFGCTVPPTFLAGIVLVRSKTNMEGAAKQARKFNNLSNFPYENLSLLETFQMFHFTLKMH